MAALDTYGLIEDVSLLLRKKVYICGLHRMLRYSHCHTGNIHIFNFPLSHNVLIHTESTDITEIFLRSFFRDFCDFRVTLKSYFVFLQNFFAFGV